MKAKELLDGGKYTSSNTFSFGEHASIDVKSYAERFGKPSPTQVGTWHFANHKGVEIFRNTGSFEVASLLAVKEQRRLSRLEAISLRLLPIE